MQRGGGRLAAVVLPKWLTWTIAVIGTSAMVACALNSKGPKKLAEQLKFSHKKHVEEADCSDCHEGVDRSKAVATGRFIRKDAHGGCEDCHEEELEEKNCGFCHLGKTRKEKDIRLTRVDRHLSFSHEAHRTRTKRRCKECHPAAYTTERPGKSLVVDMAGCVGRCHQRDMAQLNCKLCHKDLHRQRIAPITRLAHEGAFLKRHGALARNTARCHTCHDQTHCAGCHARTAALPLSIRFPERTEAKFIHRGDFLGRHASESRAQPATCRKCHGANHCIGCHELQGLTLATSSTPTQTIRKVHGPGFMTPTDPDFHGQVARRDINRCASCHDRGGASNCVLCHKVGASGGNPHPASFRSAARSNECLSNRMCLTCHTGGVGCGR